ncbi:hypothetical protein LINGRAHAP2_LOCUS23975, partial [Linum grandiflorum]
SSPPPLISFASPYPSSSPDSHFQLNSDALSSLPPVTFRFRRPLALAQRLFLASQGIVAEVDDSSIPISGFSPGLITVSRHCWSGISLIYRGLSNGSCQIAVWLWRQDSNRSGPLPYQPPWPLPKPMYALHHDLAMQWKICPREVQVFDSGHGLIQFLFSSKDVKNVVLKNQLWCYKNHILNLIPWETPSQSVVDRLQFMALTVQLLEVPQHCLTTEFGKEVMAPVGEVLSADMYTTRPNGAGRPFIKVVV